MENAETEPEPRTIDEVKTLLLSQYLKIPTTKVDFFCDNYLKRVKK